MGNKLSRLSYHITCVYIADQMLCLHVTALLLGQEAEESEVDGMKEQVRSNMRGVQTRKER